MNRIKLVTYALKWTMLGAYLQSQDFTLVLAEFSRIASRHDQPFLQLARPLY